MDIEALTAAGIGRLAGRRLGPYRLVAALGSGGMGEVYRAIRADDEYDQEVAIKLVRAGLDLSFTAQRLRAERQILAGFTHPAIARLLDGGTTDEGIPYLVMELVEGQPITEYCKAHGLGLTARLELFLQVCSAVQYAHQRMVVHRDLKPSNILVNASGAPKLLDFGIAKILDPGAAALPADATINASRILTPQYASPEQIAGEPVTAASDVYSLGVILYELLTGVRPYPGGNRLTRDVPRAVYEPEPRKPSAVVRARAAARDARRLRGDLDNIVLLALRREPARRYASVERLAQDIERYLQHRPVSARRPTLGYRAARFAARHALAASASALAILALAAGFSVTAWEAHVASVQRERAERRLDDIRKLARTLIFDIHDSIADLPGAAHSRRLVIETALRYLGNLSAEAADDPILQRQLAGAYLRLGDLQGRALEANEGDYDGASASYRHALALLEASLAADRDRPEALHDLAVACGKLSDLTWNLGDGASALAYARRTIEVSARLAALEHTGRAARILLATSELDYGYKLFKIRGDAGAGDYLRRSVSRLEALSAAEPADAHLERTLALAYGRRSEFLLHRERASEALSLDLEAHSILERLAAGAPRNADYRHLLAFADHDTAGILTAMGRLEEAERTERTALAAFEALAASDPQIDEYRVDVGLALAGLARIASAHGEPLQALDRLRESLTRMESVTRRVASAEYQIARAGALEQLASLEATLAADPSRGASLRAENARGACAAYARAAALYRPLAASWIEAADGAQAAAAGLAECSPQAAASDGREVVAR